MTYDLMELIKFHRKRTFSSMLHWDLIVGVISSRIVKLAMSYRLTLCFTLKHANSHLRTNL